MTTRDESKRRTLLAASATGTLIGIALCTGTSQELGAFVTLAGLLGLIFGVHRFGRLGPDAPLEAARERRAKPASDS